MAHHNKLKRSDIATSIAQAFQSESLISKQEDAARDDYIEVSLQKQHEEAFITELARDVAVLFFHHTGQKYGTMPNMTSIPSWDGGDSSFILDMIPAKNDDETGDIIADTFSLEMHHDLKIFWEKLAAMCDDKYPITFDAAEGHYTTFRMMTPQPENISQMIAAYMEEHGLSSLDGLQVRFYRSDVDTRNTLNAFNETARQEGHDMRNIHIQRIAMMPPGTVYNSEEDALLDGEISGNVFVEHQTSILDLSLKQLVALSAQARGTDVPLDVKGYIIH